MTEAVLRCEGLSRHVGEARILSGVSLQLQAGEWVALLGPSGAGKSTLLQLLGLLDRPSAGRVLLDGQDAWALPDAQRTGLRLSRVGFVFQQHNLLPQLTALENVALPAWRLLGTRARALERARELLQQLGLPDRAQLPARLLSVGEAQRVAIARALVNRPAVVLADEPTGSLDSASAARTLEAFAQVRAAGVALLMVTHDEAVAAGAARRLRLQDGALQGA